MPVVGQGQVFVVPAKASPGREGGSPSLLLLLLREKGTERRGEGCFGEMPGSLSYPAHPQQ